MREPSLSWSNWRSGIADGVGGWRDSGVDPSVFSFALMAAGKALAHASLKPPEPMSLLEQSHNTIARDGSKYGGKTEAFSP